MLSIRLSRVGKKKKPIYRVIVTEKSRDPWGSHVEILGWKNPHTKEVVLKEDRVKHWLSVGAQPTETVHNLLVEQKLIDGKKFKSVSITKKRTAKMNEAAEEAKAKEAEAAEAEAAAEPAAEEPASEPAEAPAEEKPAEETPAEEKPAEKTPEEKKPEEKPAEEPAKEEPKAEEKPSE